MNYQDNIYKHTKNQQKKTKYNPMFINYKLLILIICILSLFFWMKSLYNSIEDLSINNQILNNSLHEKNEVIIKLKKENKNYISIIKKNKEKKKEKVIPRIKKPIKDTINVVNIIKDTL